MVIFLKGRLSPDLFTLLVFILFVCVLYGEDLTYIFGQQLQLTSSSDPIVIKTGKKREKLSLAVDKTDEGCDLFSRRWVSNCFFPQPAQPSHAFPFIHSLPRLPPFLSSPSHQLSFSQVLHASPFPPYHLLPQPQQLSIFTDPSHRLLNWWISGEYRLRTILEQKFNYWSTSIQGIQIPPNVRESDSGKFRNVIPELSRVPPRFSFLSR